MSKKSVLLAAAMAVAVPTLASAQVNGTWIGTVSGNWGTSTNWAGGTIPDVGGTAFLNDITGQTIGHTLTIDTSRTLSEINWNTQYSLGIATGTGQTLTMGSSGLTFNSIKSLTNSPTTTFVSNTVSAQIVGTGNLTKIGAGSANISNATNTFTGSININDGILWNNTTSEAAFGTAAN
jgi:autotransporter-associated beta strand protein